jgi:hypothetical protein
MVGAVWLRLCGPGLTSARAFSFQTTETLFHFAVATFVISTDNQGQEKTDEQEALFFLLLGID